MRIIDRKSVLTLAVGLLMVACKTKIDSNSNESSLKTAFKNDFYIGTALDSNQINEKDPVVNKLIVSQFNVVTPENIMKCEKIHPEWNIYNFEMADKLVAFGKKYNIGIIGHTLVWHEQLAPFVKNIKSKDSLRLFLSNHISTVAGRYKGKVLGWDVVNEALNEDGTYRKSIFFEKLGEDFIVDAFKLAEKATPNTELYYNDFNIENPKKRAGAITLLKKVKASGARIDGVGIQGHWGLETPALKDIEESIIAFSDLGLKVMITELDISVLPSPFNMVGADVSKNFEEDPKMNPYKNGLPEEIQNKLAKRYSDIFKIFIKHKDKISRVTFWGVNDQQSWLNDWPIKNRTNYPLFFDRNNKPKMVYNEVINLKKTEN
jgi:endo-1,4-beta-xylanase